MSAPRLTPAAIFVLGAFALAAPLQDAAAQEPTPSAPPATPGAGAPSNSGASKAPAKAAQDPAPPSNAGKAAPKAAPKKRAASPAPAPESEPAAPTSSAGCGWIGKRVIHALLRDDAVTAQDFDRLYHTFSWSGDQLRAAFDCTAAVGALPTAAEAQTRVDSCWNDPKFDTKRTKIAPPSETNTSNGAPAAPAPSKSGAGKGAAAPVTGSTPNYPEPKSR